MWEIRRVSTLITVCHYYIRNYVTAPVQRLERDRPEAPIILYGLSTLPNHPLLRSARRESIILIRRAKLCEPRIRIYKVA
jgi:hypothetical protein